MLNKNKLNKTNEEIDISKEKYLFYLNREVEFFDKINNSGFITEEEATYLKKDILKLKSHDKDFLSVESVFKTYGVVIKNESDLDTTIEKAKNYIGLCKDKYIKLLLEYKSNIQIITEILNLKEYINSNSFVFDYKFIDKYSILIDSPFLSNVYINYSKLIEHSLYDSKKTKNKDILILEYKFKKEQDKLKQGFIKEYNEYLEKKYLNLLQELTNKIEKHDLSIMVLNADNVIPKIFMFYQYLKEKGLAE